MNHFDYETIRTIEIDITSYCNSFCGRCARNNMGGEVISSLPLKHLSLESWDSLIRYENLKNIEEIIFNGSFGDFSMHPNIIQMLEKLSNVKSDIYINAHTNGSARTSKFWFDLASVMKKFHKHSVTFGIDGLHDTHSIYRRGTKWNNIMTNTKYFIDNGGYAVWKSIVFDHNKHQISQMETISKSLGFSAFQTNRNTENPMNLLKYKSFPEALITSPDKKTFDKKFKTKKQFKKQVATIKYDSIPSTSEYNCPYAKQGMIMIDMEGNIWPCCYFHGNRFNNKSKFDYMNNTINIKNGKLEDIMKHKIFSEVLPEAWQQEKYTECNNCQGVYNPIPNYK